MTSHYLTASWPSAGSRDVLYYKEMESREWKKVNGRGKNHTTVRVKPGAVHTFFVKRREEEDIGYQCFTRVASMSVGENLIMNPSFEEPGGLSFFNPFPNVKKRKGRLMGETERTVARNWETVINFGATQRRGVEGMFVVRRFVSSRMINCLLLRSAHPSSMFLLKQYIWVNETRKVPLAFSFSMRSVGVSGEKEGGHSITLDLIYDAQSDVERVDISHDKATRDWEKKCFLVRPRRPVLSVQLYITFSRHKGAVYYGEMSLKKRQEEDIRENVEECAHADSSTPFEPLAGRVETISSTDSFPSDTVTLAYHLTLDRFSSVIHALSHWEGPLSVALLVKNESDVHSVIQITKENPQVEKRVDFHLFFPNVSFSQT